MFVVCGGGKGNEVFYEFFVVIEWYFVCDVVIENEKLWKEVEDFCFVLEFDF